MTVRTDDVHELVAAYSVDALDGAERERFEEHLDGCDACRAELAELSATAVALADAAATVPPSALRDRVMAEIRETPQLDVGRPDRAPVVELASRRRRLAVWSSVAAAAVVVVVGLLVVLAVRDGDAFDHHLAAPDLVVTELAGDGGSIRVAWSPERDRVAVFGDDLASPGPGRIYELWAIADGTPAPAALLEADDGTIRRLVDVDDVDVEAWGVTIEPAGGSPVPTGDILYFAEIDA